MVQEVDCVLTTIEIVELLNANGVTDLAAWEGECVAPDTLINALESGVGNSTDAFIDDSHATCMDIETDMQTDCSSSMGEQAESCARGLASTGDSSSGGYLEHIMRRAAKALYNVELLDASQLKVIQRRSADHTEFSLVNAEGACLLHCARVYGFRNIQNLVRKVRDRDPVELSMMPDLLRMSICRVNRRSVTITLLKLWRVLVVVSMVGGRSNQLKVLRFP